MADANGREVLMPGYAEGSNTDIAHEFAHMITNQWAYEANASVIRTYDAMAGTVLDIKV